MLIKQNDSTSRWLDSNSGKMISCQGGARRIYEWKSNLTGSRRKARGETCAGQVSTAFPVIVRGFQKPFNGLVIFVGPSLRAVAKLQKRLFDESSRETAKREREGPWRSFPRQLLFFSLFPRTLLRQTSTSGIVMGFIPLETTANARVTPLASHRAVQGATVYSISDCWELIENSF